MSRDWRPGATPAALAARAGLLEELRAYFRSQGVLEVETPLVASCGVTDVGLTPLTVNDGPETRFLQTSPEYAMKRLLADGAGDIYQICKAFRAGEWGRRHNPEYTLLEWYRVGWDHRQLAREVASLVCRILGRERWQIWPYGALFKHLIDVDPQSDPQPRLQAVARRVAGEVPDGLPRLALLDLLMTHAIEPRLAEWGVVVVTDYPADQAALARTMSVDGAPVACRFECYADGWELANGYWELQSAEELSRRFENDNQSRVAQGLPSMPIDEAFISAHRAGLPDCAGVALGVDRLLARRLGADDIRGLLALDWSRS